MRYDLYVLTNEGLSNGLTHLEIAEQSYDGGADVVQLRVKDLDDMDFLDVAKEIAPIAKKHRKLFIVNDRLDIALASGAGGVHLGQSDGSVFAARNISPKNFVIGVSVGNVEEALAAEREGASYVALSPVFTTPSKADAGEGHGLEMLRSIKDAVKIPVIAIGGMNKDNIPDVIEAGADGIAVISAVVSQPDIVKAARDLKKLIKASKDRR